MITCTKQPDCPATSHFGDCLSMEYRRVDPPAAPAENGFTLLSVLKAAANYIILPEEMEQLSPGAREAIIKGLTWAIHEVEAVSTPAPTAPDERDEQFAQGLYDSLAPNDDINSWHRETLLPMIAKIASEYAATVRAEAVEATFRQVVEVVMERGEILHRGNLIAALESARTGKVEG